MSKLKVGFIGLGLMGNLMAKNILKAGYPLSVYNRTTKKTEEFKKLGAKICHSPAELAKNCDVLISMVTGPDDVKEIYLGPKGVIRSLEVGVLNNLIVVDMSTIGPSAAREVAKGLNKRQIRFLDAPVTGSTDRAKTGELSIFIGGDEKSFRVVKPVLEAMGTNLLHMGPVGFGQAQKLVNNLLVGLTTEALAEGFLLGDSLGLKRSKVAEALQNVFAVSAAMKGKMPLMVDKKYPTAFSVANIRKDLKLALVELGKEKKLPSLERVEKLYKKAMDQGWAEKDLSAVIEVVD